VFRLQRREEGQSSVELALLLPVLLLIMAGVLDIGRAFQAYVTVANAAREGARHMSLHQGDCFGARDRVIQEAAGSGVDLSSATVIFQPAWCSPGSAVPGDPIKVTVTYQFQPIIGLILGGQKISISTSASMVQF
jgi:Flp pilus assembly protein TadG